MHSSEAKFKFVELGMRESPAIHGVICDIGMVNIEET